MLSMFALLFLLWSMLSFVRSGKSILINTLKSLIRLQSSYYFCYLDREQSVFSYSHFSTVRYPKFGSYLSQHSITQFQNLEFAKRRIDQWLNTLNQIVDCIHSRIPKYSSFNEAGNCMRSSRYLILLHAAFEKEYTSLRWRGAAYG